MTGLVRGLLYSTSYSRCGTAALHVHYSLKVPVVASPCLNTMFGWLMSVGEVQAILHMGQPQTICTTG